MQNPIWANQKTKSYVYRWQHANTVFHITCFLSFFSEHWTLILAFYCYINLYQVPACFPGYEGRLCDQEINECERDRTLCGNGTCFNIPGSYTCQCPTGLIGHRCQVRLHLDSNWHYTEATITTLLDKWLICLTK